ncbi:hypothetical protein [Priestia megaterium]|uniref:hypothetical protein n=1 Tax=Priestia megaterium TaxID=1404 RepID=UPI00287785B7|nr:hypothetical protein [Priestia megaterium]
MSENCDFNNKGKKKKKKVVRDYDNQREGELLQQSIDDQYKLLSKDPELKPIDNIGNRRPSLNIRRSRLNAFNARSLARPRLIQRRIPIFSTRIPEFRIRNCNTTVKYPCGLRCTASWEEVSCRTKYCSRSFKYACAIQRRMSQFILYVVVTYPDPRSFPDRIQQAIQDCLDQALREASAAAAAAFAATSETIAGAIAAALEAGVETFYDSFINCLETVPDTVLQGLIEDIDVYTTYDIVPRTKWKDIRTLPFPRL